MIDVTGATWRKSSRSNASGACVEVATDLPGGIAVRDSKDPHGAALVVGLQDFQDLLDSVKASGLQNP